MTEYLLHFLWKYKLFEFQKLTSVCGKSISIQNIGFYNEKNEGADFSMASIKIDDVTWHGDVEIHLKTSDWDIHKHDIHKMYKKVILHVVYKHDMIENTTNSIPILELKNYVSEKTVALYQAIYNQPKTFIPCEAEFPTIITQINKTLLTEKHFIEKLQLKTQKIQKSYKQLNNHWEALLFSNLAYSFGLKINAEIFENIAINIPFSVIQKESHNAFSLEALLFGKADLLHSCDHYAKQLQTEYLYLLQKHNLNTIAFQPNFLRLRPANFPTIRLSQLASIYHKMSNLFSKIIDINHAEGFYKLFAEIETSNYWKSHYNFGKESNVHNTHLSKDFIKLLILNTFIPIQFAYYQLIGKSIESIFNLAETLTSEENTITKNFKKIGFRCDNAQESQAILHIYKNYCLPKKCLDCEIGYKTLHHFSQI